MFWLLRLIGWRRDAQEPHYFPDDLERHLQALGFGLPVFAEELQNER